MSPRYKDKKLDKLVKTHRKKSKGTKVFVIYFSCGRHFPLLKISILSLSKSVDLNNIYLKVSEDYRDPLSDSQRDQLRDIIPDINIAIGPDIDKGILLTLDNLKFMIREYRQDFYNDVKYICKVDSDTIIMKDIFKEALACDSDVIGDMYEKRIENGAIKYKLRTLFQAGSYFLGRRSVQHIYGLLKSGRLKEECDSLPEFYARYNEDHMFYALSKSFGGEVKHINYDLVVSNPLFLEFISDYYVLHFYSAKDLMLKVADKILQNTGLFFSKP